MNSISVAAKVRRALSRDQRILVDDRLAVGSDLNAIAAVAHLRMDGHVGSVDFDVRIADGN